MNRERETEWPSPENEARNAATKSEAVFSETVGHLCGNGLE